MLPDRKGRPLKVLLVEDERTLSRLIYEALVHQLFTVETAFDGEEALFRIHNYTYDAIILDILLPKRSGWEVLDEARKTGVQTPVLLLTALSQVEDRVRGLNTGADDYLAKPFDIRELVARVQALIRSVKTKRRGTVAMRGFGGRYHQENSQTRRPPYRLDEKRVPNLGIPPVSPRRGRYERNLRRTVVGRRRVFVVRCDPKPYEKPAEKARSKASEVVDQNRSGRRLCLRLRVIPPYSEGRG